MEARRRAAVPRLRRGEPLASIARSLGVSRQAVHKWARQYRRRGAAGLRRRCRPGRPPKLAPAQLAQLPRLLAREAEVHAFSTLTWTTQRVADMLWQRFRVRYDRDHVCRLLHRLGWSWQKAGPPRAGARRSDPRGLDPTDRAGMEKKAPALRATLVLVRESGFSLAPTPRMTWFPGGQMPVLCHHFDLPKGVGDSRRHAQPPCLPASAARLYPRTLSRRMARGPVEAPCPLRPLCPGPEGRENHPREAPRPLPRQPAVIRSSFCTCPLSFELLVNQFIQTRLIHQGKGESAKVGT